jgi:hypothetical protein
MATSSESAQIESTRWLSPDIEHLDVVNIGAGLSGIGAACRLRRRCPERAFAVLEVREASGRTWDLFHCPGFRSDSDMFALGYPFRPRAGGKAIADRRLCVTPDGEQPAASPPSRPLIDLTSGHVQRSITDLEFSGTT